MVTFVAHGFLEKWATMNKRPIARLSACLERNLLLRVVTVISVPYHQSGEVILVAYPKAIYARRKWHVETGRDDLPQPAATVKSRWSSCAHKSVFNYTVLADIRLK